MLYGDEDCPMHWKVKEKKKEDVIKMTLANETAIETIVNLFKDTKLSAEEILLLIKGVILHNRTMLKNISENL